YLRYRIDENHVWMKVKSIEETTSETVCDIEIDHPDHSFETVSGVVANSEMCRFGSGVKDLMGSLIPAIPLQPGTGIINESAPFGYGEGRDAFRQWCEQARSGKDQYQFIGIYWWMQPEYRVKLDAGDTLHGRFRLSLDERRLVTRVKAVSLKELGYEVELSPEQIKYRRLRIEE